MISAQRRILPQKKELPPLVNGDHLDQKTFHERYEAMPEVRAELIGGVVFMASPQKLRHGFHRGRLAQLTFGYADETPGTRGCDNSTSILGPDSEPQPDSCLFILPEYGGHMRLNDKGYLTGPPEWVGEISDITESIDLHRKKLDYEKAGVREYMVVAVRTEQVFRFIRRRGKFKPIAPDSDGIIRSETFPGLWVDVEAFLQDDSKRLQSILREGLASAEHAAFVAKLAKRK